MSECQAMDYILETSVAGAILTQIQPNPTTFHHSLTTEHAHHATMWVSYLVLGIRVDFLTVWTEKRKENSYCLWSRGKTNFTTWTSSLYGSSDQIHNVPQKRNLEGWDLFLIFGVVCRPRSDISELKIYKLIATFLPLISAIHAQWRLFLNQATDSL